MEKRGRAYKLPICEDLGQGSKIHEKFIKKSLIPIVNDDDIPVGGYLSLGENVDIDMHQHHNILVCGMKSCGKTEALKSIIATTLFRYTPDEMDMVILNLGNDKSAYDCFFHLPHLRNRIITDKEKLLDVFKWLGVEVNRRIAFLKEYRGLALETISCEEKKPRDLCIIIDELYYVYNDSECRKLFERFLPVSDELSIYFIGSTQCIDYIFNETFARFDFSYRICMQCENEDDYKLILNESSKARIEDCGDVIVKDLGKGAIKANIVFYNSDEIKSLMEYIYKQIGLKSESEYTSISKTAFNIGRGNIKGLDTEQSELEIDCEKIDSIHKSGQENKSFIQRMIDMCRVKS